MSEWLIFIRQYGKETACDEWGNYKAAKAMCARINRDPYESWEERPYFVKKLTKELKQKLMEETK